MTFSDFPTEISIASLVPVILVLIKNGIDSLQMQTVEKIFLTTSKKLLLHLTNITLIFSLIGLFFYLIILYADKSKNFSWLDFILFDVFVIGIGIVTSLISNTWINFLAVKVQFTFQYKNEKWRIIRRVDKKTMLIARNPNETLFVNVEKVRNEIITRELYKEKKLLLQKYVLKYKKISYSILTVLILTCILIPFFSLISLFGIEIPLLSDFISFLNNKPYEVILITSFIVIILIYLVSIQILMIYSNNHVLYELSNNKPQNNNENQAHSQ
ncbi:hypothetical protein [Ureibacillus sp. FSL W8-0352]|uniref:hypothetical protein n=1 Tax=Ureibacillus sp. FSL W8-0352 TaxID=2954596 RepID=UPI0030FA65F8